MISLYNEDCFDTFKRIKDGIVDLVLVDPPYGTTKCSWDEIIPIKEMWLAIKRVCRKNATIIFTATQPFASKLIISNLKDYKYDWIWDKVTARGHLVAKHRPMSQHEHVLVFSNGGGKTTYNPQMIDRHTLKTSKEYKRTDIMGGSKTGSTKLLAQKYPKTIQSFSNASAKNRLHPTEKPLTLIEYLIKTYSNERDIVLDFAMGSGTTGLAAKNLNRSFIGCEIDKTYYDIAEKRIGI